VPPRWCSASMRNNVIVTGVKQAGRWVGIDACRIRYKCYN